MQNLAKMFGTKLSSLNLSGYDLEYIIHYPKEGKYKLKKLIYHDKPHDYNGYWIEMGNKMITTLIYF